MSEERQETMRPEVTDACAKIGAILDELEKVIVGKRSEMILLLTALFSGSHILIEDVPGTGKTMLASTLSRVTGLSFKRAQFTPDVMASDITGFNIYNRQKECFEFREGLVMCHLMLADEINRASPKTQSALLEAMEEGRVTVDGVTYPMPDPFMVIATQNPSGYVGTYPLPEAQLDRFALKIRMGYPSSEEEIRILKARHGRDPLAEVRVVLDEAGVREICRLAQTVHVDDEIFRYIVNLTEATRKHSALALGASPRASVALMRLCMAYALIRGRDYVLPDDVAALFRPAVCHRLILGQEARLSRLSAEDIAGEILRSVTIPYRGTR